MRSGKWLGQGPGRRLVVHQDTSKSTNLYVDTALNPDAVLQWWCSTSRTLDKGWVLRSPSGAGLKDDGAKRVVQPEYKQSWMMWFSVWSAKNKESDCGR